MFQLHAFVEYESVELAEKAVSAFNSITYESFFILVKEIQM